MRIALVSLLALLYPVAATAQTEMPNAAPRGAALTKSEYLDRARERAAKRFEKLDANHDGVLSAEERRGTRQKKRPPQQTGAH